MRRNANFACVLALLIGCLAALVPSLAAGQVFTDPDSPAGKEYAIPIDEAPGNDSRDGNIGSRPDGGSGADTGSGTEESGGTGGIASDENRGARAGSGDVSGARAQGPARADDLPGGVVRPTTPNEGSGSFQLGWILAAVIATAAGLALLFRRSQSKLRGV